MPKKESVITETPKVGYVTFGVFVIVILNFYSGLIMNSMKFS